MKLYTIGMTGALVLAGAVTGYAQGNGAPAGRHYNLNIHGVSNPKTQPMTGSDGHSIFVALGTKSGAPTRSKIYLYQGEEFQVCDANAFDSAIDCAGSTVASAGAVFQLPCNTNIVLGGADVLAPCDGGPEDSYAVFARALGQPGGSAVITTCATDKATGEVVCSTENTLDVLARKNGQPLFQNVTQELTSLVACVDTNPDPAVTDIVCTRYALFRDEFSDFYWQYDNNGLRLAQLRFYRLDDLKSR